jgi:PPK2 family polyphosphate:nucleotide phosphotransferase
MNRWSVLVIFQGMDAAGKDGAMAHVMAGIDPQATQMFSFKAPSMEELDHDFMWRTTSRLPERGRIGIFNRSYYEEVLVVRVHPEFLEAQRLPDELVTKKIWEQRFESINDPRAPSRRNGTAIIKIFLHISKSQQKARFLDRLEQPHRRWKFSMGDLTERRRWDDYMNAYEDAIRHTSTEEAPWYVIPADHKWFARAAVAAAIVQRVRRLDLEFPKLSNATLRELEQVRKGLLREGW